MIAKNKFLSILASALIAVAGSAPAMADSLVILTTNDSHSNIDTDSKGRGGILPRKAIVDSVRKAEKNVMLIDAGDMVQGTLYFNYFKGEVENKLANLMNYDIRILGNHEFDNGLDDMVKHMKGAKAALLSANYDFKGTKAEGLFKPYIIKKIGGKKIGFIGINIDPENLISKANYEGMKYSDAIDVANKTAEFLKNKQKCDLVVAVTHIGYTMSLGKPSDITLAQQSRDIDIIIGGHTHTEVNPDNKEQTPFWINNANGQPVLVTQSGKYGNNLGYIKIDLNNLKNHKYEYEIIPVTDRFSPAAYSKEIQDFLAPYKSKVDSVYSNILAYSNIDMVNNDRKGPMANWTADIALEIAQDVADSIRNSGKQFPNIDFSIMNVGGIRQPMRKGPISEGQILSTYPFSNYLEIISIKGKDIIEAFRIAASKGGESVSHNIRVLTDDKNNLQTVLFNGKPMDPEKEYTVATIDYIAGGNDDLVTMKNHKTLWLDSYKWNVPIIRYLVGINKLGLPVSPDTAPRFLKSVKK